MVDYTDTTGFLEGINRVKYLKIEYTTEGGNKIVLWDGEVAEVTWSDGSGVVRVEGKTSAAASSGLNLLEMLTGKRSEPETADDETAPEPEKKTTKPAKKATTKSAVAAQPVG